MGLRLPISCTANAFYTFQGQVGNIDHSDSLVKGACAIAMHFMDDVDPEMVNIILYGYANHVYSLVKGSQPQALLAHLHEVMFDDFQFGSPNIHKNYNPLDSLLPDVINSRQGTSTILSLIYKVVAERMGLQVWGVGIPGYFLTAVNDQGSTLLINSADHGRLLTPHDVEQDIHHLLGQVINWNDDLLLPIDNRKWLTAILQELIRYFYHRMQYSNLAAMLELGILLWPQQKKLKDDLSLLRTYYKV
jgi:regulator of sirC expression with transglutaminase-like and TPR domain